MRFVCFSTHFNCVAEECVGGALDHLLDRPTESRLKTHLDSNSKSFTQATFGYKQCLKSISPIQVNVFFNFILSVGGCCQHRAVDTLIAALTFYLQPTFYPLFTFLSYSTSRFLNTFSSLHLLHLFFYFDIYCLLLSSYSSFINYSFYDPFWNMEFSSSIFPLQSLHCVGFEFIFQPFTAMSHLIGQTIRGVGKGVPTKEKLAP